jgi:hypothetical protein
MIEVTFSNYTSLLYNGARIIYGNRVGVVESDSGWNGGFKINGRSIRNILEEFDVILIRECK